MQGVRRYSVPRQVWRILYPIFVYFLAQGLAESAAAIYALMGPLARNGFDITNFDAGSFVNEGLRQLLQMTLPAMTVAALVTLPLLGLYLSNDREDRRIAGIAPPRVAGGVVALSIVFGAAACLLGNELISLSSLPETSSSFINVEAMLFSSGIVVEIIVIGVLIPIVEELVYRGLAFRRMRDTIGFLPAMLVSAFLFALAHGNIVQGLYAFGVGILLAYVCERSGCLAAPILLHITANTVSVLITELSQVQTLLSRDLFFFGSMAVSAALIVVCILAVEGARVSRRKRGIEP